MTLSGSEAEALLQKFLEQKLGERHRYLDEHLHNGLPDRTRTERQLEASGARVVQPLRMRSSTAASSG